jgi:hypothetical protein
MRSQLQKAVSLKKESDKKIVWILFLKRCARAIAYSSGVPKDNVPP